MASRLTDRLEAMREERNRRLNTLKTAVIDDLFETTVGIKSVSGAWYWKGMSSGQAGEKVDRYIELRGSIAHRGSALKSVRKGAVTDYFGHIQTLVSKTGGRVGTRVRKATGVKLF